jgi:hypothetical protein
MSIGPLDSLKPNEFHDIPVLCPKNELTFSLPDINKRKELIAMIGEMVTAIEKLPQEAMYQGVSQYDHHALLLLLQAVFLAFDSDLDCKERSCDISAS